MIKFRTTSHGSSMAKIEPIEVIRETEKQVVIIGWRNKERRLAKQSNYENFFDTWDEAHQFLISHAENLVNAVEERLSNCKANLDRIKGLTNDNR